MPKLPETPKFPEQREKSMETEAELNGLMESIEWPLESPEKHFRILLMKAIPEVILSLESSWGMSRIWRTGRRLHGSFLEEDHIHSYEEKVLINIKSNKIIFSWTKGHDLEVSCKMDSFEDAQRIIRIANIINFLQSRTNVALRGERFTNSFTRLLSREAVSSLWVDPEHLNEYIKNNK